MDLIDVLLKLKVLLWMVTCAWNADDGEFSPRNHGDGADRSKSNESPRSNEVSKYNIQMPGVQPSQEDEYMCTAWKVPEEELYIVKFEALANGATVHHLILTGCTSAASDSYWSDCHEACLGGQILYAWARNAPPFDLPEDVGFQIGNGTSVQYLVIQVHYTKPFTDALQRDYSGVSISVTQERQKYVAGIFLFAVNNLLIPAHAKKVHGDVSCYFAFDAVLHPFAFRTHSHSLGRVISGYMFNGSWHLLGKGNPRWPQAFWPIDEQYTIKKSDGLVARCTYDASESDKNTSIGSTHADEMCNFYMMYYTDASTGDSFYVCTDNMEPDLINQIPADSDVTLPPNPSLDDLAKGNSYEGKPSSALGDGVSNSSRSLRRNGDYIVGDSDPSKDDSIRPDYGGSFLGNTRRGRWKFDQRGQGNQYRGQYMPGNQYGQWNQRKHDDRDDRYAPQNLDESPDEREVRKQNDRNQHPHSYSAEEEENPVVDGQQDSAPVLIAPDPDPTTISVATTRAPSAGTSTQQIAVVMDSVIRSPSSSKVETVDTWTRRMESGGLTLGQVSGIAVGTSDASVYVFHRGSRVWNKESFDMRNNFLHRSDGPIREKTMVQLNGSSGDVVTQWADGMFYMPHGLYIDAEGNFWVTDVALHQVMKFGPQWVTGVPSIEPLLVLGVQFEPGSDEKHFCKPTDVAVLHTGEFFVSDGYCNSRIMKFSKDGKLMNQWGVHSSSVLGDGFPPPSTFDVPHSVTVLESRRELCVTDRQNARVQCFTFDGAFLRQIHPAEFKPGLFALTYSEVTGNLYAVTGPSLLINKDELQGSIISAADGTVIGTWKPKTPFERPHDIAVSYDGRFIYVAETGPNRIWQFRIISNVTTFHQTVKKAEAQVHPISNGDDDKEMDMEKKETYFGATVIIGGLIAVPIVIMVTVLIFLRLRRRGKQVMASSHGHNRRFNLGSLLAGSRSSDFVGRDDEQRLELKHLQSDSEVEEFSSVTQQNA